VLLQLLPRVHRLDRVLAQSGLGLTVGSFIGVSLLLFVLPVFAMLVFERGILFAVLLGIVVGMLPTFYVLRARANRLARLEGQLPDAIDLMGRALRAGHALPTALQMVGQEMSEPIGSEFRVLFDEINYGVSLRDAMLNLLSRVPSTDLRYFVVAVFIQRETGGNLAELLDNISAIVRARIKMMGEIRTLSAEGRLSAWILTLLPFAAGALIQIANPKFLSALWTDPLGMKLVYVALGMMVIGIWWMRKIIRIRV